MDYLKNGINEITGVRPETEDQSGDYCKNPAKRYW